jgi:Uma2 family endonuclease
MTTIQSKRTRPILMPKASKATIEEYLKAEETSTQKHEFYNGIIRPMAGGQLLHNRLAQKAANIIDSFFEANDLDYIVSNSDTKIRIEKYNRFVYPDAVVICEKPIFYQNRQDTIVNPLLVVEVLSESTKDYDRGNKYEYYRGIASFKEYVLIHQDHKHVSVYSKQEDHTWIVRDYDGNDAVAVLYAIHSCLLPLKRLYRGLNML